MRRRTTASALAAVGLSACLAAGQPPGFDPAMPVKPAPGVKTSPPPDPTDALIQKALAHDPDVQVARAKLTLADAELAKARQAAVARVITLRDAVAHHRETLSRALDNLKVKEQMTKAGQVSREELVIAQERVSVVQGALGRAETELKLLTGDGPKAAAPRATADDVAEEVAKLLLSSHPRAFDVAIEFVRPVADPKALSGPVPARIRAALDVKVRFDPRLAGMALSSALTRFKAEAGLDVIVRPYHLPDGLYLDNPPGNVELPVGAWLQMFQDSESNKGGHTIYVRDYGLLIADRKSAPPDAVTLTEFWRTRADAAAAPAPKSPADRPPGPVRP